MCVSVFKCEFICMYVYKRIYVYVCMIISVYICIYVCIDVYVCVCLYMCVCGYTRVCMYVWVYVRVSSCVWLCVTAFQTRSDDPNSVGNGRFGFVPILDPIPWRFEDRSMG